MVSVLEQVIETELPRILRIKVSQVSYHMSRDY